MRHVAYLSLKILLIVCLFGIFFSYAMFQGNFVSWFLLYMISPFLIYYLLFIIYPIKDWQVKRVFPRKSSVSGQAIRIQIELTRKIPFPISYVIVEEFLPETIQPTFDVHQWAKQFKQLSHNRREPTESIILYPIFKREQCFEYQLNQLPRGIHAFKSVRLTVTDLFGFISKSVTLPIESTLQVEPVNLKVQLKWSNAQKQTGDEIASTFHSNHSTTVAGAREYVSGDRLSTIHWKATAKSDVMMTKEFDQEYNRDGTIMLFGFKERMTYEWNIALCRALLQVVKNEHLVVDFAYIGDQLIHYPADQAWPNLKDAFMALKPGATELKIETIFDQYQRSFVKGQFLLLFTDHLTTRIVERLLNVSTRSHGRITVYVTRSYTRKTKETQLLEERLQSHHINVYPITEQNVKDTRGVVTI